ncbi:MAG: synthase gamma chain [Candidatus Saccharibacteria bacterium]|nr:synthase gamma chain [Candidatus Saccharibacteria bacterium]
MASTLALKQRIKSVKGTRQITKAMQLVSASKMRRAQDYAFRSRPYRDAAYGLLARLNSVREVADLPLYKQRPVKTRLYVVITSNSGLAGAYNANVLKLLTKALREDDKAKINSHVIAIGNKGAQFVRRLDDVELLSVYPALGDHPSANDIRPVLNDIVAKYADSEVDEVQLIYTMFKSQLAQQATSVALLPASTDGIEKLDGPVLTEFEPDLETVVAQITTRLIEAQVWQAVLESQASEHSMRMIAMKNATDNAKDLIDDYTLELNTARQAAITQELAEITGGAEALNG